MKTRMIRSTPLRPLAGPMRELSRQCLKMWVASAFITQGAVEDILGAAIDAKASVHLLTGTFGCNTRKAVFEQLFAMQQQNSCEVRIWSCSQHGDFHAKLYLWQMHDGSGVAWVGSANLTDGGLQKEGELLLEIRGRWDSPTLRRLRHSFEREWRRGEPLTQEIVRDYKESVRQAPGANAEGEPPGPEGGVQELNAKSRVFVAAVTRRFLEDSPVDQEVRKLLSGTASAWHRNKAKALMKVRQGDRCIYVDLVAKIIGLVEVTDVAREEGFTLFAYEPIVSPKKNWIKWNSRLRSKLIQAGVHCRGRGPRPQWLSAEVAQVVIHEILYPGWKIS